MSGHRYISNPSNLFEDDVDDIDFLRNTRQRMPSSQYSTPHGGHIAELERQRQAMLERQREIEQRTVESSTRSVMLLRESEQIGVATAEELARQREQLQNTDKRLDEINVNLRYSQKHLNGIKSVFSGLKNYLSGKSDSPPPKSNPSPSDSRAGTSSSKLDNYCINDMPKISNEDRFNHHPAARLRGLEEQPSVASVSDSQRVNEMLDANLDEMVQAITRLKGLGSALAEEIDQQNDLIDTIHDKVEIADIKIGKQNKEMNKILGK
ncbi:Synaptosomal-associated protein 29 [Eumeta japonica]|uniref:Synaptosomal-associated protein 29 n=1 Tax=Eumeta variegata TaxID=151549 RepID=A0A4C1XPQ4_EUMVA|nr:Synaptosomal-associated protein 29 [Eumeta japonica]